MWKTNKKENLKETTMEITSVIKTEKGQLLTTPKDGFIVLGCIFVSQVDTNGNPNGGLIGDGNTAEKILDAGVKPTAYTWQDFIKALMIDPYELKRFAEEQIPHSRGV